MEHKEIWKTITGFKDYQVSNMGRIKSLKFNKELILKPLPGGQGGYEKVSLFKNGYRFRQYVGHLVLITFIGPCPMEKQISHLDGNQFNNRLSNLKWETHKENQQRNLLNGIIIRGKNGRFQSNV